MTDHDDRVRGFGAFSRQRRGARFATSWWGNAWIKAMEETSLDRGRLSRGRTYARTGHVGSITLSPGRIAAPVHGSEPDPYTTVVTVEQLGDAEWERFLDQVAARAGHIAALLDRDMPHDLVESAADAGVPLLPGVGDLEPECTCLDWGYPCKHAAALCYQVSWLLDANPFLLLLLRGRGERELVDDLMRRNADHSSGRAEPGVADAEPPTVDADTVFATEAAPLPDAPEAHTGVAPPLALPPSADVDTAALAFLAADAAHRAASLLEAPEPRVLDTWQDTVRIAATCQDERVLARLTAMAERRRDLPRAAAAWVYGGTQALEVLETPWSPERADLAHAWDAVVSAWEGDELPGVRGWRNRWTVADRGAQLRYGRDRRWYPYRERSGVWWPAGVPDRDPAAVLADLLGH